MSAPLKSKYKQKLRAKLPKECAWCGAMDNLTNCMVAQAPCL